MAVYKNKASQKVACFAYNVTDGAAKTGDSGNITAQISLDGAATAATNDVNPAELDATDAPGLYLFDLTQAETNADLIVIAPLSATASIKIEPLIIYTEPEQRVAASVTAGVSLADNAITSAKFDESTAYPQTGDAFARLGAPAGASVSADVAAVKVDTAAIMVDTGTTLDALIKDIPTVAEFEARTLVAADYTVVSDLPIPPTVEAIADGIWDELLTGHATAGSAGLTLGNTSTAIALASVATVTDSILVDTETTLDTLIKDIPTVAEFNARTLPSADYTIVSDLPAAPDNASIALILEDTGTTLPATLTTIDNEIAVIDGIVDSILEDTGTTLPASIAALPTTAKKNIALANFAFIMTDSTNHELTTGLTVTCTRSVDGGAFAAGTLANVTEIAYGVYNVDFGAGDLNGDVVVLRATATGADDTIITIVTSK